MVPGAAWLIPGCGEFSADAVVGCEPSVAEVLSRAALWLAAAV